MKARKVKTDLERILRELAVGPFSITEIEEIEGDGKHPAWVYWIYFKLPITPYAKKLEKELQSLKPARLASLGVNKTILAPERMAVGPSFFDSNRCESTLWYDRKRQEFFNKFPETDNLLKDAVRYFLYLEENLR